MATSHKVALLAGWGGEWGGGGGGAWLGGRGWGLVGGGHQFRDARALVELKGQVALYMAHSNIKQITHHNKKYICIEVNLKCQVLPLQVIIKQFKQKPTIAISNTNFKSFSLQTKSIF